MSIHPTAFVAPEAELGEGVQVGPFVVIEAGARVGDRCRIGPHCVIKPWATLGSDNFLDVGVVLGAEPQDAKFQGEESFVRIGDRNKLREYVTIHRATGEGETTALGSDNFMMAYSHLGHNTVVGDGTMIGSFVGVGGHCTIEDRVNMGGFVGVHQYSSIGTMAMVGGMTAVNRDVPPCLIVQGVPMQFHGINVIGLRRNGVGAEERQALHAAFKAIYHGEMNTSEAIAAIRQQGEPAGLVRRFIEFIERIERGYRGRQNNPH